MPQKGIMTEPTIKDPSGETEEGLLLSECLAAYLTTGLIENFSNSRYSRYKEVYELLSTGDYVGIGESLIGHLFVPENLPRIKDYVEWLEFQGSAIGGDCL